MIKFINEENKMNIAALSNDSFFFHASLGHLWSLVCCEIVIIMTLLSCQMKSSRGEYPLLIGDT